MAIGGTAATKGGSGEDRSRFMPCRPPVPARAGDATPATRAELKRLCGARQNLLDNPDAGRGSTPHPRRDSEQGSPCGALQQQSRNRTQNSRGDGFDKFAGRTLLLATHQKHQASVAGDIGNLSTDMDVHPRGKSEIFSLQGGMPMKWAHNQLKRPGID